jgi:hypothetical protein
MKFMPLLLIFGLFAVTPLRAEEAQYKITCAAKCELTINTGNLSWTTLTSMIDEGIGDVLPVEQDELSRFGQSCDGQCANQAKCVQSRILPERPLCKLQPLKNSVVQMADSVTGITLFIPEEDHPIFTRYCASGCKKEDMANLCTDLSRSLGVSLLVPTTEMLEKDGAINRLARLSDSEKIPFQKFWIRAFASDLAKCGSTSSDALRAGGCYYDVFKTSFAQGQTDSQVGAVCLKM